MFHKNNKNEININIKYNTITKRADVFIKPENVDWNIIYSIFGSVCQIIEQEIPNKNCQTQPPIYCV